MIIHDLFEEQQSCPHCGGPMFSEMLMMEKKDACYYKVKASAKVWPSAYASGRLVQCRKKGADSYGNKSEGLSEMDKSQTPPGRDGSNDSNAGKKEYTAKATTAKKVAKDAEKILNKELNKKQGVAETMSTFSAKASTRNSGSGEFRGVSIPSDMKHPEWREPTWSFQEIAQKLGIPVATLNLLAFNRIGGFPEALSGLSARHGSKKYYKQSEVKRWVNANNVREKLKQGVAEGELDEGWKSALGAAALAGTMAMGAGGAQARVTPDGQGGFTGGLKPSATVTAPADNKPAAEAPKGFSKEYLQKAANPDRFGRFLISVEKAQELLKQMNESKPKEKEADYGDDYQDMVSRVKKLAGLGPLKTVYDPAKRVYRNVPTAVQPPKK